MTTFRGWTRPNSANSPGGVIDISELETPSQILVKSYVSSEALLTLTVPVPLGTIVPLEGQTGFLSGKVEGGYLLTVPLPFQLEVLEDGVCAEILQVDLWAIGRTRSEAVQELKERLVDYFEALKAAATEQLGNVPQRHLRFLETVLDKV